MRRLFNQFRPDNYEIELSPDRDKMTFSGAVIISGYKVGRPASRLTLHQSGLKIINAEITKREKKTSTDIPIKRINHHKSFDEVRLHSRDVIYPGHYTIKLSFRGQITQAMNGMYPSVFQSGTSQKKLIATQFESHHAREVFPCIDEPEAKATFDLSLIVPSGETVLSNTPIKKQEIIVDQHAAKLFKISKNHKKAVKRPLTRTVFEKTPVMSTYLLAFVFGELDYKESKTKQGVVVRTYATPDNVKFTNFSLDVAVKCLEFYNDYFGIEYPLAKCDMVAMPDFASGAMENWGLVTYREQTLLIDPHNSTLSNKQWVAMVIAHELAHQWFGNLVTMRWWTDLWLNEGFASWIEFLAIDHIYPEWEMWTQFALSEQQQALKLDALEHTHPIEVPVRHPDEIRSIFDTISYSKGASIIHMLHEYLGKDSFKEGLRHYLKRHAYGNTDTIDLWQALEEVSKRPVKNFMQAWTKKSGFPILRAEIKGNFAHVSQQRFFINPEHGKLRTKELWPVALLSNSSKLPDQLARQSFAYEIENSHNFRLNQGQSGFYRVTYDSAHLQSIEGLIAEGGIPALDRLGILSDVFEAAKAGQFDTTNALRFLSNFRNEKNYAVWEVIASSLGSIKLVMNDEELRKNMKPATMELIANELSRLGWERKKSDSHFDRLLRPTILGIAAGADDPAIIKRCRQLFDAIEHTDEIKPDLRVTPSSHQLKRGIDIDPDMRGVVFGTISRHGDKKDFEKMVRLHNSSTLSEERTTISAAITNFKQPELIEKALSLIDSKEVRLQDVSYWIAYSFLNRYARTATWHWLKSKWGWLEKNLGTDLSFYRMPIYVARVQSDRSFLQEYDDFFRPKLSPALKRSYDQGYEMIVWQSAWKERDLKHISAFYLPS